MGVYTVSQVERLLKSYIDFQFFLTGQASKCMDTLGVRSEVQAMKELPLGLTTNDPRPWPFHEIHHAKPPRDGKARAKSIQEIHVSMIDIEVALRALTDDDLELIYKYFLLQSHTLEELCAERKNYSRGSMLLRCRRAVGRLVVALDDPC